MLAGELDSFELGHHVMFICLVNGKQISA